MKRSVVLLALLLAAPAAARPVTYLCSFDAAQSGYWVGPVIQIAHDPRTGRAEVLDPLVMRHAGGPVEASARPGPGETTVFRWLLLNVRSDAGQLASRLVYELTLRPADGIARGRMRPAGYPGVYSASGRCGVQE